MFPMSIWDISLAFLLETLAALVCDIRTANKLHDGSTYFHLIPSLHALDAQFDDEDLTICARSKHTNDITKTNSVLLLISRVCHLFKVWH